MKVHFWNSSDVQGLGLCHGYESHIVLWGICKSVVKVIRECLGKRHSLPWHSTRISRIISKLNALVSKHSLSIHNWQSEVVYPWKIRYRNILLLCCKPWGLAKVAPYANTATADATKIKSTQIMSSGNKLLVNSIFFLFHTHSSIFPQMENKFFEVYRDF